MNEEILVRKLQEEKYGPIYQPTDKNTVMVRISGFREALERDLEEFKRNPSAKNFTELKMSMYWYQYWSQKAIYDEVEE
jgi:hypothetical protein